MATGTRVGMPVNEETARDPAPLGLRVGHVHLKVADLERAVAFYRDVLGLDVV